MIYVQLFLTFFKIGLFTFGGGYAMVPLVRSEVLEHGWMSETDIINFIAVSESTPGPFAVNMSTYVGRVMGGLPGALTATLGVVLPSFVIILLVAAFFKRFQTSRLVSGAMRGLRPAVPGLIAAALYSIGKEVFLPGGVFSPLSFGLSAGVFLLMSLLAFKKAHPILIIALSAGLGMILGYAFGL